MQFEGREPPRASRTTRSVKGRSGDVNRSSGGPGCTVSPSDYDVSAEAAACWAESTFRADARCAHIGSSAHYPRHERAIPGVGA